MLRLETESGWWLVTHPDHARLAGAFAEKWGNKEFIPPEPRRQVLLGIATHDDGWVARDAQPQITRRGVPSAFSIELVGKYSAFEEIDLADYLAVRGRAVSDVAEANPYAALLVSLHTYNLLTERADRSTIAIEQLPLLDTFLERQRDLQQDLHTRISMDERYSVDEISWPRIEDHFRLLQATDNLSLLSCVDYRSSASLLHPLPTARGEHREVAVESLGNRHFRLTPYPFSEPELTFKLPVRHVEGKRFESAAELQELFHAAPISELLVTITK
jgi:Protein of unknown function (DUF3891)